MPQTCLVCGHSFISFIVLFWTMARWQLRAYVPREVTSGAEVSGSRVMLSYGLSLSLPSSPMFIWALSVSIMPCHIFMTSHWNWRSINYTSPSLLVHPSKSPVLYEASESFGSLWSFATSPWNSPGAAYLQGQTCQVCWIYTHQKVGTFLVTLLHQDHKVSEDSWIKAIGNLHGSEIPWHSMLEKGLVWWWWLLLLSLLLLIIIIMFLLFFDMMMMKMKNSANFQAGVNLQAIPAAEVLVLFPARGQWKYGQYSKPCSPTIYSRSHGESSAWVI